VRNKSEEPPQTSLK